MIYAQLKYLPTGNIIKMPEIDAKRYVAEGRGDFEIVGAECSPNQIKKTSTYNKVVDEVKPLSEYNYQELKTFAKEHNLKQSGNKEELRKRCIEFTEQEAEKQKEENTENKAEQITNDN